MRPRALWAAAISLVLSACSAERDLPAPYRTLAVPVSRLRSPEARQRGERLYGANCVLCHGERLDGRGARQIGLSRPPRNFTDESWRRSTSPRRVFYAIREGLPDSAMPAWRVLDDSETWDLVAYVLALEGAP